MTLLAFSRMASGQSCSVLDTFDDGSLSPTWFGGSTPGSVVNGGEFGGQLRFWGSSNIFFDTYYTAAWSSGWSIDMSHDWAFQMEWYVQPPWPEAVFGIDTSEVGLVFGLMLEGDPFDVDLQRGITISAHRGLVFDSWYQQWVPYNGESINYWIDGVSSTQASQERIWSVSTMYVWYDAAFGVLYFDSLPPGVGGSPLWSSGVSSISTATTALLGVAAYSQGAIPGFADTALAADNLCMLYGTLSGPRVGACVVEGGCFETIAESCGGDFSVGMDCDDLCTCDWDVDCSGDVGLGDITLLIDSWGPCEACVTDLTDSGDVGVADLLVLLEHWSGC
jgi:hypothetical protein